MEPNNRQSFVYSVKWTELVFSSRTIAEELLIPELEAGHLSSADYEKAISFLPRAKQYAFRPIGGVVLFSLAALLGLRYRRPKWTTFQQVGVVTCLGCAGFTIGKLNMLKAHAQFIRSIENPKGFFEAMRNIESRTGLQNNLTEGIKFTTLFGDEKEISQDQALSNAMPGTSVTQPEVTSKQTEKALSRWDEIRMANNRSPTSSPWDAVVEKNAKKDENS